MNGLSQNIYVGTEYFDPKVKGNILEGTTLRDEEDIRFAPLLIKMSYQKRGGSTPFGESYTKNFRN